MQVRWVLHSSRLFDIFYHFTFPGFPFILMYTLCCQVGNKRLYVVPKLEYHSEFGAECLSESEVIQQWMSLYVRPGVDLCRVRVNVITSEVIMVEQRTLQELGQQCQQQFEFPVSRVLGSVYNILLGLLNLEPGTYLLSHTPQLSTFVNLRSGDRYLSDKILCLKINCCLS